MPIFVRRGIDISTRSFSNMMSEGRVKDQVQVRFDHWRLHFIPMIVVNVLFCNISLEGINIQFMVIRVLTIVCVIILLHACEPATEKMNEAPLVVTVDKSTAATYAREVRDNTTLQLADGIKLELWASDSLAPDPIAMSIDDFGNVYLTRTNRQKNSEFDIRGYPHWMTESISWQDVEDRRAFLHRFFAPEKSQENDWLPDLNNDGSHDWKDLAVEKDEIWKLEDVDGDGLADQSTRILNDFHDEVTDVAGALLVRRDDVFVGIGPDMWRVRDTDGDGILDEKTSISHGYAVHIGFSGHGMSGAIEGPDGKIYWGIGDIGANITTSEGVHHKYPNQGIIVRSNPDGSDFEVFAHGLRNTHEFVFDEYGNIISADNDGDHRGESERLVYIVEDSDAGWRANWQYGKYTDPKNNDYKVWMDERLFVPRWDGQAAYIIPPIMNFHNGPTGMVYNPGHTLGKRWMDKFFLVEFVGNPSRSPIWSFSLKPDGAGFALDEEEAVVTGILPTGIHFGPDGALYAADWINGWGTKNYGRVWRMDVTDDQNDLEQERKETARLMGMDYAEQSPEQLDELLGYGDMRIRQKAQFELVKRKNTDVFNAALQQRENQLKRVHAIWGIGQLTAEDLSLAGTLVSLLQDEDPEIVAQASKVIGDVRYTDATVALIGNLTHTYPRAQFYAAQALGRIKAESAVSPLLDLLRENNDQDLYIRHAAVSALARIGEEAPIIALEDSPHSALRLAAVLVLRKWSSPEVARFLDDTDEYIATEAARAINDDWSIEPALPALAALINTSQSSSEPLMRRVINACLRVGTDEALEDLIAYAQSDISPVLRAEALATIGTWADPSVMDRVDGRYRGEISRDLASVQRTVEPFMETFLKQNDPEVLVSVSEMIKHLELENQSARLETIFKNSSSEQVRSSVLTTLAALDFADMESLIQQGMQDNSSEVRTTALGMLDQLDISAEALPGIATPIFAQGTVREQQQMLRVLGSLPLSKTEPILKDLMDQYEVNRLAPELALDLSEAIDSSGSESLKTAWAELSKGNSLTEQYADAMYGGNMRDGWIYFNRNPTGQCTRCHSMGDDGATVGPNLRNIGNQLSREELLQALVEPSARISPGYGVVVLTLKDGTTASGTLVEEREHELILRTNDAEPLEIAKDRIETRENLPSSMPPVTAFMSKREIRDVVEFLANLKREEQG